MINQCSQRIYTSSYRGHQCPRRGSVEEGGSWWCKQHAPSLVRARREESQRKWKADFDRRWRLDAERDAENKKLKLWKKHGPALLAAARHGEVIARLANGFVTNDSGKTRILTSWGVAKELREIIAACEQIEGKDDD